VERCSDPRPRRRAGGDPPQPAGRSDDTHSRYIEAAVGGLLVRCLYLPNGNPAPGPKFDYKLRLVERLTGYSQSLWGQRRAAPISRGTGSSNPSPSSGESTANLIPRSVR
jgi:exonuclease III